MIISDQTLNICEKIFKNVKKKHVKCERFVSVFAWSFSTSCLNFGAAWPAPAWPQRSREQDPFTVCWQYAGSIPIQHTDPTCNKAKNGHKHCIYRWLKLIEYVVRTRLLPFGVSLGVAFGHFGSSQCYVACSAMAEANAACDLAALNWLNLSSWLLSESEVKQCDLLLLHFEQHDYLEAQQGHNQTPQVSGQLLVLPCGVGALPWPRWTTFRLGQAPAVPQNKLHMLRYFAPKWS